MNVTFLFAIEKKVSIWIFVGAHFLRVTNSLVKKLATLHFSQTYAFRESLCKITFSKLISDKKLNSVIFLNMKPSSFNLEILVFT